MKLKSFLFAHSYRINDKISIVIPTVGEVSDHEDDYFYALSLITATPYDLMVQLYDAGIDYSKMTDYELFLHLFGDLASIDTSLIFGDLDLSKFQLGLDSTNQTLVLMDSENDIKIDMGIYDEICAVLRRIHHLDRNWKTPGNEEAMKFMIERARKKMQRAAKRKTRSELEKQVVSMVNAPEYKYGFEETRNLTIYQFNECVYQILNRVRYDKTMIGCYAGTIKISELSQDDLTWLAKK